MSSVNSYSADRYQSLLVEKMKQNNFQLDVPPFKFFLAEEFGFCYGVGRAVTLAFEARDKNPDKRIFLTNEIIHNPRVNNELKEAGIQFLDTSKKYESLTSEDVVILPAFGVSIPELQSLKATGCKLIDTACGSVMAVWRRVEKYAQNGFTSLIHGKYDHEETRATCSQVAPHGGHYIVVRNLEETEMIARFIETGKAKEAILKIFQEASSKGFDPEKHLEKIGCANQTTMLSSDSLKIAERIQKAFVLRYGAENLDRHFMQHDTICSATQDRQDAVYRLIKNQTLDLMLVIGGFNSSNTSHLLAIAAEKITAFHISEPEDLISNKEIKCKQKADKEPKVVLNWLPAGAKSIGVTAGASTPNRVIEDVIRRFLGINNLQIPNE